MASFPDLPAELFQMVIHELVVTVIETPANRYGGFKIGPIWKLRSVCRSFAAEIEREVFSQQPKEFYNKNYNIQLLVEKCLPRYMMQVSRKPGSVNEGMFTQLQRMAHYAVEHSDFKTQEERADIIKKTYVDLRKITAKYEISHALFCDRPEECRRCQWYDTGLPVDLPYQDRLCAALSAGNHRLLSEILPKLNVTNKDRVIHTRPIWFALKIGDLTALDIILRYLETRPSAEQIVLTQTQNMFSILECVNTALQKKDPTAAQLLLDYYEKNLPCPPKDIYHRWVGGTSARHSVDRLQNFRAVLNFDTGGKKLVGRDTVAVVCTYGSSAAIREFLQQVGDVDKGTVFTAPIFIAVRSGRAAAIQACLQAGANVDLAVRSNIWTIGKTYITPLDAALHRHDVSVANALIEGGAAIPHISHWPTHRRMYRLLHAAASKLTNVRLPDLRHFKVYDKEDLKALQY